MSGPLVTEVRGDPTDDEVVAVVAAIDALWPRPVVLEADPATPPWRFSGRSWMATGKARYRHRR